MRSITNYRKVEGHESLIRDMDSKAIIATDDLEYKSYMLKRKNALNTSSILKQNTEDINQLKNDLTEIKKMLITLIKDR